MFLDNKRLYLGNITLPSRGKGETRLRFQNNAAAAHSLGVCAAPDRALE